MACLQNGTVFNNNKYTVTNLHDITYDENNPNKLSSHQNVKPLIHRNCTVSFKNKYTKDVHDMNDEKELNIQDKSALATPTYTDMNESQNNNCDFNYNKSQSPEKDIIIINKTPSIKNNERQHSDLKSEVGLNIKNDCRVKVKNKLKTHNHELNMDQISINDNQNKSNDDIEINEPPHHARRPMNAFLIFCKRHRTVVKNKYPHLENRAVTKILGEWWAGLETDEKSCYTELAQEYKNAFFSANPNFKWYKLPAPPLRTLNTRPANYIKMPPSKKNLEQNEETLKHNETLFNPGKLADETQLGSITSLINIGNQNVSVNKAQNIEITETEKNLENITSYNDEISHFDQLSPIVSSNSLSVPPKPFKKRVLHQNKDNKNIIKSIFNTKEDSSSSDSISSLSKLPYGDNSDLLDTDPYIRNINNNLDGEDSNVTKQDLIDKVVDHMCTAQSSENDECLTCLNKSKISKEQQRTSVRSCKGLRYAKFMAEGKLLVNKRSKKSTNQKINDEIYQVPRRESIELTETIKKLAERTSKPINIFNETIINDDNHYENKMNDSYEENMKKMFRAADFNLDEKIEALPSLSLEKFQQKKKESKKKKIFRNIKSNDIITEHKKEHFNNNFKMNENNNILIGSRKRKPRKQSITRLDLQNDVIKQQPDVDLFALATLAEVAAKKAKIDQQ